MTHLITSDALSQADGAQEFTVIDSFNHTIDISFSAEPTAGLFTIEAAVVGGNYSSVVDGTISVDSETVAIFQGHVNKIRVTPAGFDADKTYVVRIIGD